MEDVRFDSRILHPEVHSVTREEITEALKQPRATLPFYSKYEQTALIAIRAQQLAEGAKPLVGLEGFVTSSPRFVWEVAEKEIREKKLPFIVHRKFANGISEYWSANELSIIW
jgi:DNA-directed RNA polymerase I, II, and III subunit RPABC2